MDDTAIKNALDQQTALLNEIKEHRQAIDDAEAKLERVNSFISAWYDFADEASIRRVEAVSGVPVLFEKPKKHTNPKKEYVAEQAEIIIREKGRPMPRAELFEALARRGIEIYGKDPEMVFSTMLWRMRNKIVRLPSYGYWITDEPCPMAGYDPNDPSLFDED